MKFYFKNILFGLIFFVLMSSCVEEYPMDTEVFESVLVIEASITNELTTQEVKLSRSFRLEEDAPIFETQATVKVKDGYGNVYDFHEAPNGLYQSQEEFAAEQGVSYQLEVVTANGREYISKPSMFSSDTQIDELWAERGVNENDEDGMRILLNTQDVGEDSRYYRYIFEETYKVIAPLYSPYELHIENDDFPYPPGTVDHLLGLDRVEFFVTRHLREEQEQICYGTYLSDEIHLVDATDFNENNIENYMIRFIGSENYIISHRYSIWVKQIKQSLEGHLFYKTLNNFSDSESLFSQVQTGFINGNIVSLTNPLEKVVGFFEVVAVDEKRIFFNYEDFYPGEILPPYYIPCNAYYLPLLYHEDPDNGWIGHSPIQDLIKKNFQYYNENLINDDDLNMLYPYFMVLPACGDCTVLGENVAPDFWIE